MRLKALRLHGFKSFADRTEVVFHDGITAIVGPNGCGKSNISDAIRWVLGEQRPSAIRGARMDEAIFQGTTTRRPVNRGSVTMEVTNEDGVLPVAYEEVEIARTVYRDGGSEYSLNRSPCRLRDIQDLCRDTGLGANAYSIIENRMIDAILSDRAEERRGLFEEAAGIGKYKDRRKGAIRRLERAEQDLQRLADLIGEVQSKVRSLARQKGQAERFHALRSRRLDLEMGIARIDLSSLAERRDEIRKLLEGGLDSGESLQAEIRTAETRLETLKIEGTELERARTEVAGVVDEIRGELVRWEREMAVAEERKGAAERRLDQIRQEREALDGGEEEARSEGRALAEAEEEVRARLEAIQGRAEAVRGRAASVRQELREAREGLDEVEGREREVARKVAQLLGDADASRTRGVDLGERMEALTEEVRRVEDELAALNDQGDLFSDRSRSARKAEEEAREALEDAGALEEKRREEAAAARESARTLEDEVARLEARLAALERLERDREGVDPVVRALLEAGVEGVEGVVADFLVAEPEVAGAVEAFLGGMARAVVVRDQEALQRVRQWFRKEWKKGGGIILLPLDRAPTSTPAGSLLDRVTLDGPGAQWAGALLDGVEFLEEGVAPRGDGVWVTADGTTSDARGVVRLGNPLGATGIVERRGRIEEIGVGLEETRKRLDEAQAERGRTEEAVLEAREALEGARGALREAEDAHRAAKVEVAARSDRRERLEAEHAELGRRLDAARKGAAEAERRAADAEEERGRLESRERELLEARTEARAIVERVQESWEEARSEESRVTVEETRLEAEAARIDDRRVALRARIEGAKERRELLAREEEELRAEVQRTERVRSEGEAALSELFRRRDEAHARLRERDEAWNALQETVERAEKRLREARSSEREVTDRRHRLELELGEIEGRIGRVQDRLEGEWGRSLDALFEEADPVEGEKEELETELRDVTVRLERLGPVNMLAVEEHREESQRLEFLTGQRDDLDEARDDLRRAIREINQTATRLFRETFDQARENFRQTFHRLFQGGECDLWLEDPDDPLESLIEIHASPRGKRTQRIDLLSGGERALTALSLLFGIYLVKPSPFCVLDEVDAPLDESNIGRFIRLLQEFKEESQFVVITHNPRTIEAADWIYGVTMEEPGVSSIVGVRLEEALEAAGAAL
jgi:chromosome segregation protein